jgi:hypothetical protein
MIKHNEAITLTFGDQAENHKGMEKYGELADKGICIDELYNINKWFVNNGAITKLIEIHNLLPEDKQKDNEACILVIKNGINVLLNNNNDNNTDWADLLMVEQAGLTRDIKAFMYGRVVNKKARHNLCFSHEHLEPNYEAGRGMVYAFEEVPLLNMVRNKLGQIGYEKIANLQIEGNYYYDPTKCGIGWHGDSERRIVVGLRLGTSIPLCYRWYYDSKPVSDVLTINNLDHGDIYIMSEKAVGTDWKKKKIYTLRHSAGCEKFTNAE